MLKFIYLISLTLCGVYSESLNKNTPFQQSFVITPNVYNLYWNYTDTDIIIRVEAATTGWLAFALTPVSGVSTFNSDFILAWVDPKNGTFVFKDCHVKQSTKYFCDSTPKWIFRFQDFSSTMKVVIFSRALENCYGPNEIALSSTNFVAYSLGTNYNASSLPDYSNNMGRGVVPFLSELNDNQDIDLNSFDKDKYTYSVSVFKNKNILTKKEIYFLFYF